ncbi:hypothetical protein [Acinetobacter baumannii]|uniref:hypothetical protein n=1 Tax=Acinetobacter baumannii TaxID=470 RepID=UPI003218E2CC
MMLRKQLEKVQISLLELLTALSFVVLGFCLIYKYSFYNTLDISWFISYITPQFLFLTSLKLLFTTLILCILGFTIGNLGTTSQKRVIIMGFLAILLISFFTFYYYQSNKLENPYFEIYSLRGSELYYYCYAFTLSLMVNLGYRIIENDKNEFFSRKITYIYNRIMSTLVIITLGILLIYQPMYFGSREAIFLLKNKEKYLNKVNLKASKEEWFLIEAMGDKYLLIDKKQKFKVIEYKDIDVIQSKKSHK